MQRETDRHFKFDWLTILLYLLLVGFGWLNILSASHSEVVTSYFDMSQPYGKQLLFICISAVLIFFIFSIEAKFYERFSSVIYIVTLVFLLGLFVFGTTVNGATSWYTIGSFTIQPSEFAKAATALAVAKYISDIQTDITTLSDQLKLTAIISIPALLILLQNDTGSTVVYTAFVFVLYREGIPQLPLAIAFCIGLITISTLKFGVLVTTLTVVCITLFHHFFIKRKKKRKAILQPLLIIVLTIMMSFTSELFYKHILKPHQQDRISLWLRLEQNPDKIAQIKKTYAYNLNESEIAISSGGFLGKGYMEGTRTTGKFVPEQHTDYIFTTIGEEWGFLGSTLVIIGFTLLLWRIIILAEKQKKTFSRVYGYSVASIIFIHFLINIGMVMGLIPTIGIPLPFFSYGGSALFGFTILLFIFLKLDSNRINEW